MPPAVVFVMGLFLGINTCQSTLELGFSNGKVAILALEGLQPLQRLLLCALGALQINVVSPIQRWLP